MKKTKKSKGELMKESRAWSDAWVKKVHSYPQYGQYAQEWDAEYAVVRAMAEAREAANLSQAELAARMGISQPAVSRALKGNVTIETFARILAACGFEFTISTRPSQSQACQFA